MGLGPETLKAFMNSSLSEYFLKRRSVVKVGKIVLEPSTIRYHLVGPRKINLGTPILESKRAAPRRLTLYAHSPSTSNR